MVDGGAAPSVVGFSASNSKNDWAGRYDIYITILYALMVLTVFILSVKCFSITWIGTRVYRAAGWLFFKSLTLPHGLSLNLAQVFMVHSALLSFLCFTIWSKFQFISYFALGVLTGTLITNTLRRWAWWAHSSNLSMLECGLKLATLALTILNKYCNNIQLYCK